MPKKERVPSGKKNTTSLATDGFTSVRRPLLKLAIGETFEGVLVDVVPSKYKHALIFDVKGDEVSIYADTVLETLITENDIGREYRIRRNPDVKSKGNRKYHNYDIASKGEPTVEQRKLPTPNKGDNKKTGKKGGVKKRGKQSKSNTKKKA